MESLIFFATTLLMAPVLLGVVVYDLLDKGPVFVLGAAAVWVGTYLEDTRSSIRADRAFRGIFETVSEITVGSTTLGTFFIAMGALASVAGLFMMIRRRAPSA